MIEFSIEFSLKFAGEFTGDSSGICNYFVFLNVKDGIKVWGYIFFFFLFSKIISNVVLLAAIRYKWSDNNIERAIKGTAKTVIIATGYQKILGSYSFSITILWINIPFKVKKKTIKSHFQTSSWINSI